MKSKIFFLALMTVGFLSCSKYSGPDFNNQNGTVDSTNSKTSGGGNNGGSGGSGGTGGGGGQAIVESMSFKADGVEYVGTTKIHATQQLISGIKIATLGYAFKRKGENFGIVLNIFSYDGKKTYVSNESDPNNTVAILFNKTPFDMDVDTTWQDMKTATVDVVNVDSKSIEVTFSGTAEVSSLVGSTNTIHGSIPITDGKMKVKWL